MQARGQKEKNRRAGNHKFIKSAQTGVCVVPFDFIIFYACVISKAEIETQGEIKMNTDKIYAEAIAKEYAPKSASKVVALKKLDQKAKRPAQIFTYTFGVVATLLLGVGMCLAMHVIGGGAFATGFGIVIGCVGIAGIIANYPIYQKLLAAGKQKYAFEIMQLAKEISEAAE